MSNRSVQLAVGEFYHVYNRGVDKRNIFLNSSDYYRFQELLYLSNSVDNINVRDIRKSHDPVFSYKRLNQQVAIGAYCLMPNHFHILLKPLVDQGVSTFMRKLSTSYSMYFNKRYDRTGSLFEGKFKARHADGDEYLKYLFSYIHLNPVKLVQPDWKEVGIKDVDNVFDYLRSYKYSSLSGYLHLQVASEVNNHVVDSDHFPGYFIDSAEKEDELLSWLSFNQPQERPGVV